jgi:putative DNA primase/helicase
MSNRKPKGAATPRHPITPELVRQALGHIPPDVDRDTWARLAMAIKSEFPDTAGFDLWNDWSAQGQGYDEHAARDTWRSVKAGGKVTIGTLFGMAKDRGFSFPAAGDAGRPQSCRTKPNRPAWLSRSGSSARPRRPSTAGVPTRPRAMR